MSTPLQVLLIQDSKTGSAAVLEALRRGGYDPIWACVGNPDELSAALAAPWELVLCDWPLAGDSGATLEMLRARNADVPVVAIACAGSHDEDVNAIAAGAADIVPMQAPLQLVSAVDRALREAHVRRARRRAEEALRESGERFAQAFAHAPTGMLLVGIDGITLHANRAFCAMFGYSEAEMTGMPVWRFTHPDDMPATIEQLQRLVEGKSDAWYLEKRYFHRDGHPMWGRSSTWVVRGRDGRASYVVTQLEDITAQKQLEEETRRLQADLAHVLRVSTMGEMVAEIAHEINQPLASIANFANGLVTRLERGVEDIEALRTAASQIAGEALRASDIIRRLRDVLRKGEARRECCDASNLVRDALRLIEPELRQDAIALKLELAGVPLQVEVDRVQVAQVVLNLVRNALEAVAAVDDGALREIHVETAPGTDGRVVVSVHDSGVGLPRAQETRIFDAFFTTKARGLGLGLSISRSIIEAHGGRLWAQPNHEQGTTVAFALPAAKREEKA
jgi:two-component system sensor histidine kinase DctS